MNMLQVIQKGAVLTAQTAKPAERTLPCPFCGEAPPLAARIAARFVVGCENDNCPACPQVSARTLCEAWTAWNRRAP